MYTFAILYCFNQGATQVSAYFPSDTWYAYNTGELVETVNTYVTLDAPLNVINVHLRGGYILPVQQPSVTTTQSRKNPFGLVVLLKPSATSYGTLFWDDGESLGKCMKTEMQVNSQLKST